MRKSNNISINDNAMGSGRPKLIWPKTIKNDMIFYGLFDELALDKFEWHKMIHVADLK